MNKKVKQIIDLQIEQEKSWDNLPIACSALYISAKGTKHFYETLELLSKMLPQYYLKEFLELQEKYKPD